MTDPRANTDGEQPKRLFPERPPRRRAEDPTREQQPARRRRSEDGTPEQPQPARRRRPEGPAREARPRRPDSFSTEQPPPRRRRTTDGRPSGQPPSRRRRGRDDLFPEQTPARRRRGDDLTQERLIQAPRRAPSRGWRAWLYRLTGGLLNLGPAPAEQHDQDLIGRLQKAQVSGHRHIATLSLKGGSGKCVSDNTEIVDPRTGLPHTIREVVDDDALREVLTLADRRRVEVVPITAKVDSGEQECLRVTFSSGRTVTTTLGHPFLLPDGWRRADELAVGATAALPARIPFPIEPVELPPEEVDLLAVLLAEGGCTGRAVRFSTNDPEILRCATVAAEALGARVKKVQGPSYDYLVVGRAALPVPPGVCACGCDTRTTVSMLTVPAKGYVRGIPRRYAGQHRAPSIARSLQRRHGLDGRLAKHKVMPPAVYQLPPQQLARFLAVFWMCDGYVDQAGPGVTLASEPLVRAIQHLLLRFGIQSIVRSKQATNDGRQFAAWRLTVYAHCLSTFRDAIPLWGAKRARLDALCDNRQRNANVGDPSSSPRLRAELRAIAPDRNRGAGMPTLRQVANRLGWGHFQYDLLFQRGTGTISRRTLRAFSEVFDCKESYEWLWSPDIFWDRITEVEPVGTQRVYDLMVEPTRCFVANDVIVHNTTTAVMLGHTLAQHRGDRVVAVDASPDAGTLGFRVERKTPNSLPDLLGAAREIRDYRDLKAYTSESESRLQVLAARTEPDLSSPFTPDQYRQVVGLLARFYSLVITDCSPGLLHPTMEPVLELADQLLIVVSPSVDGGRSGSLMLDWLAAHGRGDLVRNAVVVLNCLQERLLVDIGQFKEHFGQRCRAVVQIPFDPHLGQGAETSLEELRPATRTAYLELAAHVLNPDQGGKPAAERGRRS